jgi:hypothetical protein
MLDMFDTLVAERPAATAEGPVELTELLRVLVGSAGHAMSTAALVDVDGMDAAALRQVVLGVEQLRRALDATEAHALAELTERDVVDRSEGTSTSRWLAREAQLPSGVARQRVTVATALRDRLPEQVDRALTDGRIGFDHARVIAEATNERNAEQLAAAVDRQLESAQHARVFHRWRRNFQARAALLDEDGTFDPAAELARNRLRLSPTTDFMGLRGELVGDHAIVVRESLEAIADELFREYSRDHTANPELEVPNRSTLLALALEELCRRASGATDTSGRPGKGTQVHLVLHGTSQPGGSDRNGSHLGTIALDPIAYDRDGCPWLLRDVAVLLCDASVAATVLDGLGLPADAGRSARVPGPRLRRALEARDGGCVHPGCDRPSRHCDAHHIIPWEQGGPTDLDNLVLLCRRHHRVAHRRGWSLTLAADGWTDWRTPTGRTFTGQRHQQSPVDTRAGPQ